MMSSPPSAGILVLNWNGSRLLSDHLPSVLSAARHSSIPVAVADNGSTDDSLQMLARDFPEVRRIPLGENHGFGGGYNRAMAEVDWDIVVLLNNDMLVAEDFADHLLAPFATDGALFAVTAQIFLQDRTRRREETGRTSARLRAGEIECAHLPVDSLDGPVPVLWAGGGSSAVSRDKFVALGGFDDLFNPFYMEDVDLSLRAWRRGWPTLFEPCSTVEHRHRGSTSRLKPAYVDAVIARNRSLFIALNFDDPRLFARHALRLLTPSALRRDGSRSNYAASAATLGLLPEVLRRRQARARDAVVTASDVLRRFKSDWEVTLPPDPPDALQGQHRGGDGRHADRRLTVLSFIPMSVYPISHGGASRIMNTLWGLSRRGHEVHVLSLVETEAEAEAMRSMPEVAGSHAFVLPLERSPWRGGMEPTVVAGSYRPTAARLISDAVRRYRPDVLLLEYTHSGAYVSSALGVPTVLVEHDVAYRSACRSAMAREGVGGKARALFDVARLYRWELETAKRVDLVLSVSELEAAVLRRRGVTQVCDAVPNGVDVAAFEPATSRVETRDLLFVGYFAHPPNVDGLGFFLDEIWPHLAATGTPPSVSVVGSGLSEPLATRVHEAGFRYAGFVEEISAELWSHRVFICPIRLGAGTRIKLLEAAAARCAIVSTTFGAEGLGLKDGRDVLLADDPVAFAASVERLLADKALRRRLGDAAHDAVQRQFDWPVLAARLESVCYDLLDGR